MSSAWVLKAICVFNGVAVSVALRALAEFGSLAPNPEINRLHNKNHYSGNIYIYIFPC